MIGVFKVIRRVGCWDSIHEGSELTRWKMDEGLITIRMKGLDVLFIMAT